MNDPLILEAHGKHAQSVLFCKKHDLLASAGMDGKVHLWSVPNFKRKASIEGHANSVNTLSLNPKEDLLATGSSDQSVRIWSFPDGLLADTLEKQVNAIFNPDGKQLASIGTNGRVTLWDLPGLRSPQVLPKMDKRTFSLAYSPDGDWLVVGGTNNLWRYDLGAGDIEPALEAHQHAIPKVTFTPNGAQLLATGAEGALSVWDVATWTESKRIALPAKGVLQTALSHDGNVVYISMDNLIAGYNLSSGEQVLEIPLTIKGVYGLDVSADGSMLANAGADGNIRIWEI